MFYFVLFTSSSKQLEIRGTLETGASNFCGWFMAL